MKKLLVGCVTGVLLAFCFGAQPPEGRFAGNVLAAVVPGEGAPDPQQAPVNPAFLEFLAEQNQLRLFDAEGRALGYIPPPMPQEKHAAETLPMIALGALPRYDMRDPNNDGSQADSLLTPVRNQGWCGSCWTFATYGSLESSIKRLSGQDQDFSEDNLKHLHGFDWGPCDGGNLSMSTAYLSRLAGPVSEIQDPYDPDPDSTYCTDCTPPRKTGNVVLLPVRSSVQDNAYIKQAIVSYGALYTSIQWQDSSFRSSTKTYYYDDLNNSFNDANHAVVLVGWDDDKAVPGAPGNGAFIVRNSWGSSWGEGGYFYASYYDESIAFSDLAFLEESEATFDQAYYYDDLGRTSATGYGKDSAWAANRFIAGLNSSLQAVGFYANRSNTSYEIYIYGGFDGSAFSGLLAVKTGSTEYAGWYTVGLDQPVALSKDDYFYVVMKLVTPGYSYPIPIERPLNGYASGATANAGESYISSDGNSWSDITQYYANTNVCLKAFVSTVATVTVTASDPVASEAGNRGRFTVTRTGDTSDPLIVRYVVRGTATNGADYDTLSGRVKIPAGAASRNIWVTPIDDAIGEDKETVRIKLVNDTGYVVGTAYRAVVNIRDDD